MLRRSWPGLFVVAQLTAAASAAEERVAGPVPAAVLRVIDGDSIEIKARIWLGIDVTVEVRLRGIDTPEMKGHCPTEKMMATAARDRLQELAGKEVVLANIKGDKFGGRVDADVTTADGTDLKTAMLASGLARPYDGRTRGEWCDVASLGH